MIDAVIVSGGNIQSDFALDFLRKTEKEQGKRPFLAAADRGLEFFMKNGIIPDLVVGDFDSLSDVGKEYLGTIEESRIVRLKPVKDDSDTQSILNRLIDRGFRKILLLGCTGTRLDHVMANLELLLLGRDRGVQVIMADKNNYMMLAENGMILKKSRQFGRYVSVFPMGGDVEGLTLEGFRYPLQDFRLKASDSALTVSNEIQEEEAQIFFTAGTLLLIQSRD